MTMSWLVHGFADQGARLYVGDSLASPSTLFHIDHHADHTHPESGARVGNLAHGAFSSAISGNARIFGGNPLIWNYHLPFAHFGSSLPRIGSLILKNKELPMLVLSYCGQLP